MAEYKQYTVNIGSTNPIYFKSAYTGGQATAKFNGTVVITTQSEGFGDAGNATSATAQMISSDFGSALLAELTELYGTDATANPENYEVDKSALISRASNYTIKNGYSILNIDYLNVEIEANAVENDNTNVEVVEPNAGDKSERDVKDVPSEATPIVPVEKRDNNILPIMAISFSILTIIVVIVAVVIVLKKKGKGDETSAPATPTEAVNKTTEEEQKPEEKNE